jgi:hypothetical protein
MCRHAHGVYGESAPQIVDGPHAARSHAPDGAREVLQRQQHDSQTIESARGGGGSRSPESTTSQRLEVGAHGVGFLLAGLLDNAEQAIKRARCPVGVFKPLVCGAQGGVMSLPSRGPRLVALAAKRIGAWFGR